MGNSQIQQNGNGAGAGIALEFNPVGLGGYCAPQKFLNSSEHREVRGDRANLVRIAARFRAHRNQFPQAVKLLAADRAFGDPGNFVRQFGKVMSLKLSHDRMAIGDEKLQRRHERYRENENCNHRVAASTLAVVSRASSVTFENVYAQERGSHSSMNRAMIRQTAKSGYADASA